MHLIRNEDYVGSNPTASSNLVPDLDPVKTGEQISDLNDYRSHHGDVHGTGI